MAIDWQKLRKLALQYKLATARAAFGDNNKVQENPNPPAEPIWVGQNLAVPLKYEQPNWIFCEAARQEYLTIYPQTLLYGMGLETGAIVTHIGLYAPEEAMTGLKLNAMFTTVPGGSICPCAPGSEQPDPACVAAYTDQFAQDSSYTTRTTIETVTSDTNYSMRFMVKELETPLVWNGGDTLMIRWTPQQGLFCGQNGDGAYLLSYNFPNSGDLVGQLEIEWDLYTYNTWLAQQFGQLTYFIFKYT